MTPSEIVAEAGIELLDRHHEILKLLATGTHCKDIAVSLGISTGRAQQLRARMWRTIAYEVKLIATANQRSVFADRLLGALPRNAYGRYPFERDENGLVGFPEDHVAQLRLTNVRTRNCLRTREIDTISELVTWSSDKLLKIKHLGYSSLHEIEVALARRGRCLANRKLETSTTICPNCGHTFSITLNR